MDESVKKTHGGGGDKEILYSKTIKAGKRIYYLDVKRNLKNEMFLAVTESKKIQSREDAQILFEKHKIFLYKEDFDKFMDGMRDVLDYIKQRNPVRGDSQASDAKPEAETDKGSDEIKLDIEF